MSNGFGSMEREGELEAREAHVAALFQRMEDSARAAANKIILEVGGSRFATGKSTLLRVHGTYFEAMLGSGRSAYVSY